MLPYNTKLKEPSRELRTNMTDAEKRIWSKINMRQINGYQFCRQRPVGEYIVDFLCLKANLVIEIDGGYHLKGETKGNDRIRDEYLRSLGLNILRFKNSEVLQNVEKVVEIIKSQISLCLPLKRGSDTQAQR
jgi:very-short-patch-repair endonuclease